MTRRMRNPPGRAGRLWLRERLELADRAVSLLDTKVRLLRRELERLEVLATESGSSWAVACNQAQEWQCRAVVMGSMRDVRLNMPSGLAELTVVDDTVMGVAFPRTVSCDIPLRDRDQAPIGSVAVLEAANAFGTALRAGVASAAAAAACKAVRAEIAVTSQRLRALRDRWIPDLAAALKDVDAGLDELERADLARLRWVVPQDGGLD